jgi:hypothetical protein
MLAYALAVFSFMHFYFKWDNKKKLRGDYDHLVEGMTEAEANELGERNPRYLWSIWEFLILGQIELVMGMRRGVRPEVEIFLLSMEDETNTSRWVFTEVCALLWRSTITHFLRRRIRLAFYSDMLIIACLCQ